MAKEKLVSPSKQESKLIETDYYDFSRVGEYKLVKEFGHKEFEWVAIALKFKEDVDPIDAVVRLKADEYWGTRDGYHVFWWD